jgi:hypothetical protein
MRIFIFQSGKDPDAYGFSNEQTGISLPRMLAPWLLRGEREDFPDGTLPGICSAIDAMQAMKSIKDGVVCVEVQRNVVRVEVRRKMTR